MSNVTPLHNPWDESPFHVGDRIRKVREIVGFGTHKTEFARIIGTDRGTLAKYEAGNQRPKDTVLSAIAYATGARLEWLRYEKGPVFEKTGPKELPHLDSNQEPAGFRSGVLARVTSITEAHRPDSHSETSVHESHNAVVTTLPVAL